MSEQALTQRRTIPVENRGIVISDMEGMWRWSQYVAASGLAPKGMEKPESIFVATQMGLEVGLTPMAALQNIAVINGRPTIWGDSQLAIVRSTGELEEFSESYEANGEPLPRNPSTYSDDVTAVCRVKRRGYPAQESTFSVADAKKAQLWGKQGPWSQYPARMLRFRARSFALRDNFGDALRGMLTSEEAADMDAVIDVTPPKALTQAQPKFTKKEKIEKLEAQKEPPKEAAPAPTAPPPAQDTATEASNTAPAPAPVEPPIDPPFDPNALTPAQAALHDFVVNKTALDFDTFKRGILASTWFADRGRENWEAFSDVPDDVADRLVKAPVGFKKLLNDAAAK